MRIFAISDLHADESLARTAAREATRHGADIIMIAGDLSAFGREFSGIIAPFTTIGVPILMVGGNHDDHERVRELAEAYAAIHLDGYGIVIDGVGFIGTRGLTMGRSKQSDHQMRESFLRAARYARAERIVSMTHTHPTGTLMEHLSMFVQGSETIESLIRDVEPSIHVCGHVHEGAGLIETMGTTKIVNVARTPTIIDL
jgi:uncharacterized protein